MVASMTHSKRCARVYFFNIKSNFKEASLLAIRHNMYQNTEIMSQSFFENVKFFVVNIESINIAEQCVILFNVQKYF